MLPTKPGPTVVVQGFSGSVNACHFQIGKCELRAKYICLKLTCTGETCLWGLRTWKTWDAAGIKYRPWALTKFLQLQLLSHRKTTKRLLWRMCLMHMACVCDVFGLLLHIAEHNFWAGFYTPVKYRLMNPNDHITNNVLVFPLPDMRHIAPVIRAIDGVWSGWRGENAWSPRAVQNEGEIVDVRCCRRVVDDSCRGRYGSDEDHWRRDLEHGQRDSSKLTRTATWHRDEALLKLLRVKFSLHDLLEGTCVGFEVDFQVPRFATGLHVSKVLPDSG